MNIKKTKVMTKDEIKGFREIEVIESFNFLGSLTCIDGRLSNEIRRRLGMARAALSYLNEIVRSNDITRKTKINIVETTCMIFPTAMHGRESWTIKKRDKKHIHAF